MKIFNRGSKKKEDNDRYKEFFIQLSHLMQEFDYGYPDDRHEEMEMVKSKVSGKLPKRNIEPDNNEERHMTYVSMNRRKRMFDEWIKRGCSKGCSLCDNCVQKFTKIVEEE